MTIKTTPAEKSRLSTVDFDHLDFGRTFSDHMVEMIWENESWSEPHIKPYGPISFTPALSSLHYGQEIFEGMKAYYVDEKTLHLFRPEVHYQRFCHSCQRMCMPEISYETFLASLEELLRIDSGWVPKKKGRALYIRPLMFASQEFIAAVESNRYNFYFITCPVAAYYKEGFNPVSLSTTRDYVRAVRGGTGEVKTGGNYGASFLPAKRAREQGYTQVLWLDAVENRYVEEVGTMNIFFRIDDKLVTPKLSGSVLNGITRRSVIELAHDSGIEVEERKISIEEVLESGASGKLQEVFGTGTAAVISPVKTIHHDGTTIRIGDGTVGPTAQKMFDTITGIQYGDLDDPYGWTHPVRL
ncbi:MAG: branched-chain amino acid aminotransferase [Balneolaceae bacterium]